MFIKTSMLTGEDRRKVSEMDGKIMLWIMEGRSVVYMSQQLGLPIWQVQHNIDEMLYTLRQQVGKKRYLRVLFWK